MSSIKKAVLDMRRKMWRNKSFRRFYLGFITSLSSRGISLPFVSVSSAEKVWILQGTQEGSEKKDGIPHPSAFVEIDKSVEELFRDVVPLLGKDARILEIGCNAGRNLKYLHNLGFRNLAGIELGPKAVEQMKESHPDLYNDSRIIVGRAEEVIKSFGTDEYDMIFTHATLVNIHPSKNFLFREMARVSGKFILTMENEGSMSAFPRDFKKMFEKQGMKQIALRILRQEDRTLPDSFEEKDVFSNNTVRLFVHDKSRL